VDARRRAIQNAPQVLYRNEPPLELQGVPGLANGSNGEVGYVTFGTQTLSSNPSQESLHSFPYLLPSPCPLPALPPSPMVSPLTRSFLLSSLPPPPHPPTARRDNLPHPDLPRLLPLPHQSLESVHPQPDAEADGRFPAGAEPGTARERGAGEEDGEWADV
jgi:hypothetical protein